MTKQLSRIIATVCYVGYCPIAPGTAGSVVALLLYLVIGENLLLFTGVLALSLIIGFIATDKALGTFRRKDPPQIVVDEVCGMLIALFLLPKTLPIILLAFFLFRAFDTLKPFPIAQLERLPGSSGVMLDDIASGIYTNVVIQLALKLAALSTS
ncbi:phosphatidylglycerophosphatase A [Candidatus Omnitrophota bacterium]